MRDPQTEAPGWLWQQEHGAGQYGQAYWYADYRDAHVRVFRDGACEYAHQGVEVHGSYAQVKRIAVAAGLPWPEAAR